jgi:hypothetical protein
MPLKEDLSPSNGATRPNPACPNGFKPAKKVIQHESIQKQMAAVSKMIESP